MTWRAMSARPCLKHVIWRAAAAADAAGATAATAGGAPGGGSGRLHPGVSQRESAPRVRAWWILPVTSTTRIINLVS